MVEKEDLGAIDMEKETLEATDMKEEEETKILEVLEVIRMEVKETLVVMDIMEKKTLEKEKKTLKTEKETLEEAAMEDSEKEIMEAIDMEERETLVAMDIKEKETLEKACVKDSETEIWEGMKMKEKKNLGEISVEDSVEDTVATEPGLRKAKRDRLVLSKCKLEGYFLISCIKIMPPELNIKAQFWLQQLLVFKQTKYYFRRGSRDYYNYNLFYTDPD